MILPQQIIDSGYFHDADLVGSENCSHGRRPRTWRKYNSAIEFIEEIYLSGDAVAGRRKGHLKL